MQCWWSSLYYLKVSRNYLRDILLCEETNHLLGYQVVFKFAGVLMKWLEEQDRKLIRVRISARNRFRDHFSIYYWARFFCLIGFEHKELLVFLIKPVNSSYKSNWLLLENEQRNAQILARNSSKASLISSAFSEKAVSYYVKNNCNLILKNKILIKLLKDKSLKIIKVLY